MTAPIVVVGGNSRSARSFRALMSRLGITTRVLIREPGLALEGEDHILTSNYFEPPIGVFDGAGVVVNFVGTTTGPREQDLMWLNAEGPVQMAGLARAAGATGFVQLSSLSIFGGAEDVDHDTVPAPKSSYGRSKLAAETGLLQLSRADFRILIARAPMIYGPNGGGKLSRLIRLWKAIGVLPAPHELQPRSMVHVDNLSLAIHTAIEDGRTGVIYPCDPAPFDLRRLRDVIRIESRHRVRLLSTPSLFFVLLAKAAPGVYESLYARSLVAIESRAPLPAEALSLDMSLHDLVRAEMERTTNA